MGVGWLDYILPSSHLLCEFSVCTSVISCFVCVRVLTVCVRTHAFLFGFFVSRVPKILLNPANLNSTEMELIIRVWISASVLLLTLYRLSYGFRPHCTVGDPHLA